MQRTAEDAKFRSMTFAYDANGRMAKSEGMARGEALSVYDAAGMRVAEKVNDIWRYLVYDVGGKLVAEYGGWEQTGVGGVNYVMQDWQGSTRAVVNAHGFVRSRNDYTAFGEDVGSGTGLRTENQGFGLNTSVRQKYGLTTRDDATGLDHTWFRKHETQAGRWTSPDPYNGSMSIFDPQSFNRYSYVQNDPTNYVDPSGLQLIQFTMTVCTHTDRRIDRQCFEIVIHTMNIPDGGGDGGGGTVYGGGVLRGQDDKNKNGFCKRLASKIKNLREKIARAVTNLMANPKNLPDQPPFLGASPKLSQQGHRDLLGNYQDQLDRNIATYKKRCGGDPPSSGGPVRAPATNGVPVVSDNVKKGVAVGAGVVIGAIVIKKVVGAGLLFTPAAPVGAVLIVTP